MNLFLQIISIAFLPQFDLVYSDRVYSYGNHPDCQSSFLKLKCSSFATTNATWFKNGDKLDVSAARLSVMSEDGKPTLTINDITIDDEGDYSCINTNNPSSITGKS